MNDTYTPASLYAGLIGAVLVVVGILGVLGIGAYAASTPRQEPERAATSRTT